MTRLLFFALLFIDVSRSCNNTSTKASDETIDSAAVEIKLQPLASPADSNSAEPYLFTDKNGLVYLSWIEKKNEKHELKFSVLNNKHWSEPLGINSGDNWFVNWADYPQVTSDGGKTMLAHFLQKSEKGKYTYDINLVTSADQGKSWSNPKILHNDGKKAEHGFVSMIPYGDNYFVSWLHGRNAAMETGDVHHGGEHHGQMTLRGATVDKHGNKASEWELDERVCDCCQTSATITTNGPIVVYRDRSENEIRDISIVRLVNGQWTKPKPIFSDNWKIEGCPVNGPRSDAQGNNLVVAWFSSPDKKGRVSIVFSEDGGASFKTPIHIDEGKGIGRVDVVMLDDNSAMVSWMEGSVIKAARVHSNGKKESSVIIASSSESRSSGFPQMTKSGNEIIFAWTDDKEKNIKVGSITL